MDQIAALHWIQENIAEFGGDAFNVTIAGHGYGAACVNLLMLTDLGRGLSLAFDCPLLFAIVPISSVSCLLSAGMHSIFSPFSSIYSRQSSSSLYAATFQPPAFAPPLLSSLIFCARIAACFQNKANDMMRDKRNLKSK